MDLLYRLVHPHRSGERFVRQAPDGKPGCDDGAGLVQCLSMPDDVADPPVPLVSAPEKHDAVCLALEHYFYLRLPLRGGLDLLLCPDLPWFDDFHRLDGASQQCAGHLHRRCFVLP